MLSPLSRGYGTWSGEVEYNQPKGPSRENTFPSIGDRNLTGISLSATIRTKSAAPTAPLEPPQPSTHEPSYGEMYLPKTYLTRKGALLLFTAPESELDDNDFDTRWHRQRLYKMRRARVAKLIDLSLRLGNLTRLSNSVLQYGNQDYDHENASISDEKNKEFLKFLQNMDQKEVDTHAKPGGDLEFYLRDLKSRGSARYVVSGDTYLPKSRISQELQAILHGLDANCPPSFSQEPSSLGERSHSRLSDQFTRPVSRASSRAQSPGSAPPSTPKSYNVLSSKKLTASIKSCNYLGRPSSTEPLQDDPQVRDAIGVGISPAEEGTDVSGFDGYTSPLNRKLFRMPGTQPSVAGSSIAEEEENLDHLSRTLKERATSPGMPIIFQVTGEESEDEDKVDEILLERFRRGGSLISLQSEEVLAQYPDVDIASLISGRTGETDVSSRSELSHLTQLAQSIGGKVPKVSGKGKKRMGMKGRQKSSTSLDKTDTISETTSSVGSKRRDSLKIPEHMKDALSHRPSLSNEELEKELERRGLIVNGKVSDMVDATLSGPTLHNIGEGLTEEELELAKQILQGKLAAAKEKIEDPRGQGKKSPSSKSASSRKSKKKDDKSDIEKEQEEIREKHDREKKNREEEVRALQQKIAERKALLKQQKDLSDAKTKELQEEMDRLQQEADEIQRTEDDVRAQLAEIKRKQREERQARKNEMLEKKKQEIAARRERERKEAEEKRKKEQEMHEKIADAEMRRRLREEEEINRAEEERLAEERYLKEIKEQQRLAEEEEERARELERQAEEEAMQRLVEERNEAERQRRLLMEEKMRMEEESLREQELELERQRQLEEEERKRLEEEQARKDKEMARITELRIMEEKAKTDMQIALENKRAEAVLRRDKNLEARQNILQLRHRQAITRAWVFSYFIRWPRETYEQPIGGKPKTKQRPRAKTPNPDAGVQKSS